MVRSCGAYAGVYNMGRRIRHTPARNLDQPRIGQSHMAVSQIAHPFASRFGLSLELPATKNRLMTATAKTEAIVIISHIGTDGIHMMTRNEIAHSRISVHVMMRNT